jgi:glycosyltransferase involved in cell wall biosynthesis
MKPPHPIDRIVVINDLSRPMGGASALAVASARAFVARGYPVTFIAGDDGEPLEGIDTVTLGQGRLLAKGKLAALAEGLWNRAAARMVREWIERHDTPGTVYHLHGWSQILSPSILAALAPVRGRLVISAHDFFLACPNGAFADLRTGATCHRTPLSLSCIAAPCDRRNRVHKLWRVARTSLQRLALDPKDMPPVLAIHEGMRPFLRLAGIPDASIHALPNPVEPFSTTRIPAENNRAALFVGRLEATKGPDLALAAATRAGMPITIVGDGALNDQLRARFPQATFTGRLAPAEIAAHAARARLLVMPSRYPEPFGLVATEALRSGLPVVLPPTALLAADIEKAGAGLAVDPRDTVAFAGALSRLAGDDALVRAMSEAAFTRTHTLALSPDAWIDRLLDHYAARLHGGGTPVQAGTVTGSTGTVSTSRASMVTTVGA